MDEADHGPTKFIRRFFRWISALEVFIGSLALATIFVLMLIQAAQRYLLVSGWPWTSELARFCLAWLTFIMLGYLTGEGRQIALQVIDTLKWKYVVRAVKIFANLVVAATALGFANACFDLVSDDTRQVSPALEMPVAWLYVIPMVGFVLTALRSVAAVFLPALDDRQHPPLESDNRGAEVTV